MKRVVRTSAFVALLALLACQRSRTVSFEAESAAAQPESELAGGPDAGETFSFADDAAGKILAKTLTPAAPARGPLALKTEPRARTGLAALERPELSLAIFKPALPGSAPGKPATLRPRGLPDREPLEYLSAELAVPQRPELVAGPRTRWLSPDVNEPPPLASLAKPSPDRASLDDPTFDFSSERAVAHPAPLRAAPIPFMRLNLPEPFEHRSVAKPTDAEAPVVAPVPMLPK